MGQYGNEALSLLQSRLNLALQQDEADYKNKEDEAVVGLQQRLAQNNMNDATGAYDFSQDPDMANLPLEVRLGLQKKLSTNAKGYDDAQARYDTATQLRAARQQFAQNETNRREELTKAYTFQSKSWDDLNVAAPQLEGLRSDIVVDPNTGGYKQQKKPLSLKQLEEVRDEEIASHYGVDVGLVKAKRMDTDEEAARKEFQDLDRAWSIHQRNKALTREPDEDALHAHQMEQMRLQQKTQSMAENSRKWNYASDMPELVANRILKDPNADAYDREVAQLSLDIRDTKTAQLDVKTEGDLKQKLIKKAFDDWGRLYQGDYSGFDEKQAETMAEVRAHKEFPILQRYRKEMQDQKAKLAGGGADADAIYNPNKQPGAKPVHDVADPKSLSDQDLDAAIAEAKAKQSKTGPGLINYFTGGESPGNKKGVLSYLMGKYQPEEEQDTGGGLLSNFDMLNLPGMDTVQQVGDYLNNKRKTR